LSTPIVLTTLNARYSHCAFGLRYLRANLRELQSSSVIREFTIADHPRDIVEAILAYEPRIVGFGVYIWNTSETAQVVSLLKRVAPGIQIVLGGPEVSFESEPQAICQAADFVIKGEAEFLFREFSREYLEKGTLPSRKWLQAPLPEIREIASPYSLYSDEDIQKRVLYVEASRGCPYKCEYCLSSLDKSVRNFELEAFLADMQTLIDRGARQFKFVDRTFNLSMATSSRILGFFLERVSLGLFLHFEMVPDRLPEELKTLIRKFPPGSLQFEIGIQTWNPETAKLVSRRQDYAKITENFRFLTSETGVHLHADLIAGLPGEDLDSFARGFDAVTALGPHEVQVGILKRLKGTPIIRHDQEWQMVYQEHPPFQIVSTRSMNYLTLQKMARFSKFWDLYANSGEFKKTWTLIQEHPARSGQGSRFWAFWDFCEFLSTRHAHGHSIALLNRVESAWLYLTEILKIAPELAREALVQDYTGTVKRDIPFYLRGEGAREARPKDLAAGLRSEATPRRQKQHLPSAPAQEDSHHAP
jgi:radical SAM superfamily enzyme YgiQ (UPF0313 family)